MAWPENVLDLPVQPNPVSRAIARIASSPSIGERVRSFRNILVHPTQEMHEPVGAFFRGGPMWPRFHAQVLARHCRGAIPHPVDSRPLPARAEWPYFDPRRMAGFWPQLGIDPRLSDAAFEREMARFAEAHAPPGDQILGSVAAGIWCGPIILHFGQMIADFSMRIAASARIDDVTPLVFSVPPLRELEPQPHFWNVIDHFGIDRRRVMLVRTPTQFAKLHVLPQAERLYYGGPSERHLDLMDAITTADRPASRDLDCVFVSRGRLAEGRFAGETYLDEVLEAARVAVFHPETAPFREQLRTYRRARMLIFAEGSALHALQLLGRLDADIVVLARRPGYQLAAALLRPRARSLRYLQATRELVYSSMASGHPIKRAGISILDDERVIAGFAALGIDLGRVWDQRAYIVRRDADLVQWRAQHEGEAMHRATRRAGNPWFGRQ